jgi:hypothetical protein
MSRFTLNNKLSGKVHLELGDYPILDMVPASGGIVPMLVVLEEHIGTEMVLFLIDKTPFIYTLAKVKPFELMLRIGMVATSHGPVAFLLFYVRNRDEPDNPFFTYDLHLNPFNARMMTTWRDLARQSHWHLLLVDGAKEVVGFLEFANVYGLGEALAAIAKACCDLQPGDFNLAKQEFCDRYSLKDLFEL